MITDYASLRQAVADELNREDLNAVIPLFIQTMERQTERQLRTREMLTVANINISSELVDLPDDFLETRTFFLNTNPITSLNFRTIDSLLMFKQANGAVGKPTEYTVIGEQLQVARRPDSAYDSTFIYYAKIPALSDTVTTNWLLAKHPDVYFYGTLLNSAPYLKEDARIQTWITFYQNSVDALNIQDERANTASNMLKTRTKGFS